MIKHTVQGNILPVATVLQYVGQGARRKDLGIRRSSTQTVHTIVDTKRASVAGGGRSWRCKWVAWVTATGYPPRLPVHYQSSCGCYCDNTTGRGAWERTVEYASSSRHLTTTWLLTWHWTSTYKCCKQLFTLLLMSVICIDGSVKCSLQVRGAARRWLDSRIGLMNVVWTKASLTLWLSHHRSLGF